MTGPRINPLEGLGGLVQGIAQFHDPDKQKRDMLQKLILQDPTLVNKLQSNPQLLEQMVGKRPRGWGQDDYDNLINSIKNAPKSSDQLSEEFKQNEMNRALNIQKQASANEALGGLNQASQGSIPDATTGLALPFAQLQKPLDPSQQQQLDEMRAKATGSLNPLERQSQQNVVDKQNLDKQKEVYYKAQLNTVTGKYKTYGDVYKAIQRGQLSPDQIHAIEYFPESAKALDDARTEHHFSVMESLQRQANEGRFDVKRYLQESTAQTAKYIVEKTGSSDPMSVYAVLNTDGLKDKLLSLPQKPTDPQQARLWEAAQAVDEYNKSIDNSRIQKASEDFGKEAAPIINRIKGTSSKPSENDQSDEIRLADLNLLNQKSAAYFRNLGMKPLRFQLQPTSGYLGTGLGSKKSIVQIVDGDERLTGLAGDLGVDTPKQKAAGQDILFSPDMLSKAKSRVSGAKDEDILAGLKKEFPSATPEQLQATLDALKKKDK